MYSAHIETPALSPGRGVSSRFRGRRTGAGLGSAVKDKATVRWAELICDSLPRTCFHGTGRVFSKHFGSMVICCLGLLGMISIAVQHYELLSSAKRSYRRKYTGSNSVGLSNALEAGTAQTSTAGVGVLSKSAFNRSASAADDAGSQCRGFAVVASRDLGQSRQRFASE